MGRWHKIQLRSIYYSNLPCTSTNLAYITRIEILKEKAWKKKERTQWKSQINPKSVHPEAQLFWVATKQTLTNQRRPIKYLGGKLDLRLLLSSSPPRWVRPPLRHWPPWWWGRLDRRRDDGRPWDYSDCNLFVIVFGHFLRLCLDDIDCV